MSVVRVRRTARHAKPSKAAPALVAAGLTASFAVADASALAASASASSSDDFARLRQCESGGNYRINTHNGFYGAYQFDRGTWNSLGFAGRADQASPATQDAAAAKLQAQRGWGPWPACSRSLGLRNGSSSAPAPRTDRAVVPSATVPAAPEPDAVQVDAVQLSDSTRASRSRTVPVIATSVGRIRVAAAPSSAPRFGTVLSVANGHGYRSDVAAWQHRMVARGWDLQVDGVYGPRTAAVARRFAVQKHLSMTALPGEVDRVVWDAAWLLPVN